MIMFENIRKNKIKSGLIIFSFLIIISLIIYYIAMAFDISAPVALMWALIFSITSTWISYYNSDKIILKMNNARPATLEEDKKVVHILESLMISSGLEYKPKLYIVDDPQPNAFATGRNPEHSVICLTTGILEKLDYYELEGVIAHEMSHIKNYDILLSSIISVLVGFVVMLSDMFTRHFIYFHNSDDDNDNASPILMLLGLIFLIFAPIISSLIQLAVSRRREYLADATAVEFTRNPDGLISALQKLSDDPNQLKTASNATAHMYIVNPFNKKKNKDRTSLFSTHPSIQDRITAIKNLR